MSLIYIFFSISSTACGISHFQRQRTAIVTDQQDLKSPTLCIQLHRLLACRYENAAGCIMGHMKQRYQQLHEYPLLEVFK